MIANITRTSRYGETEAIIEFYQLEELLEYIKTTGQACILSENKDGTWDIEIYDDYRE